MTTPPMAPSSCACLAGLTASLDSLGGRRLGRWPRSGAFLVAAVVMLCILCPSGRAQSLLPTTWSQQAVATSPAARDFHAMAYDAAHGQVVLFGGYNGGYLGDTWLWNGTVWTQANPATIPPARANQTMAYDSVHGQVVMFGGFSNSTVRFGDTWLWDGTNWTQATPANSPPARNQAAMAYDAVNNRVVLFGGLDAGGFNLSDTWLWDGTTWTQASPQTSPSPRVSAGMAYDAGTSQVVLFGGQQNSTFYSDTWAWNGTNWNQQAPGNSPPARSLMGLTYDSVLGKLLLFGGYNFNALSDTWAYNGTNWTQASIASSPPARYATSLTYDSAIGQPVLFGGVDESSNQFNDTWQLGPPGDFGNVNVCPSGATSPSPCSSTVTFTYTFANGATLGAPQVLTQGAVGLDFRLNPLTSTCTGTVSPGTCTVSVTFAPLAPGLRAGAIQLSDNSGNLLARTAIHGVGQGPSAAFTPGTQSILNTGAYVFNQPKGLATDAAGNLYVSDTGVHNDGNRVVLKIAPNGTKTMLGTGLLFPQGIAVDGAGDLFVADNDLNEVVEIPNGCTTSSCQVVVPTPQCVIGQSGLCAQLGVAVDGKGNVFIASFNGEVLEIPANGGPQTIVYNPVGSQPPGIAVDAAGDLFVADYGLTRVVKIPAGCTTASCQTLVGSGLGQPDDVAVDAAGNVYVADAGLQEVVEVPVGCTNAGCQIVLASSILTGALTVDGAGNVFADDLANNTIVEINRSQSPSVSFGPTNVGSTSSPISFALQNVGNQPLIAESPGLITVNGPNFVSVPGTGTPTDCSAISTLMPGQPCNLSVSFSPQAGGPLASTAIFTDNALNATSTTQTVALSGTGVATSFPVTLVENGSGNGLVTDNQGQISCFLSAIGAGTGTCAGNYAGGTQVTLTANATGTSKFQGWGGACASAGTNPTCTLPITAAAIVIATFDEQNLGSLSVCTNGSTSPPCSNGFSVTFVLPTATTIGALKVVTQGATALDFSLGSGSTCVGTIPGGTPCTVAVGFAPLAPGLRTGAVQMFDSNGNMVASQPVYGTGLEPEIAFGPGLQTPLPLSGLHYNVGVAVDAAGNTFVADYTAARVVKYSPTGIQTTVPATGLSAPIGVAVDGAGDVYIVDLDLPYAVKVTPSGVQSRLGSGLARPIGIALDGAGDVYIGDQNNNRVVEITPNGVQTTVPTTGLNQPWGVAVDARGDIFIADGGNSRVVEVAPSGVQTIVAATGLSQPYGVAVDAAGDVYIADPINARVVEVPAGGGPQITLGSGLNYPSGVTVDGAGNLLIGDQGAGQVFKLNRSQPPAISFATTNVGSISTDSPVSFAVQNIGNQPLTGSLALNLAGGSFTQNAAQDCSVSLPLGPGGICSESFSFSPQSATFFSGTATFTDNNLNFYPLAAQTVNIVGTGAINGVAATVAVPNLIGQTQTAAATPLSSVGLSMGSVSTASSPTVPIGSIISENPVAGTQVAVGSIVNLLVSSGITQPPSPNPLVLENNYFVTGDYVSAGVTLRATGVGGMATGNITIPSYTQNATQGVPDGADVVDAFLYWETLENTATASSTAGTFNGFPIVGQQIGNDLPNYTDGVFNGTLRAYRAAVNAYLPVGANGTRIVSGTYAVSLPDAKTAVPITEGASLVMVYRVMSPNFPLKSVVIYDGAAVPAVAGTQVVQGFYDAVGGASGSGKNTTLFAANKTWNNSVNTVALGSSSQFSAALNPGNAYAAVILSTPVNNSDNDGILDAWKAGPSGSDFHAGQPGYYDAKTSTWVGLPGAKHGQKDLFVQLDYMCGALLASGACDPNQENLFPSPDSNGNDPLVMVQQAFTNSGVQLHLQVGNAVPEDTCVDGSSSQLCQFPGQPGVIGWKNSLEFSKLYPRNLYACLTGGDCTTRFPYGQKDSYHYVLMGHSLAIPAWNTRYGTLTSIKVVSGVTTITTVDRGTGINACPSRITLGGIIGNPALNGVYNTTGCADTKTISLLTPGVPNFTYPNNVLPEPVIGLTSGTITSISGYSDLGGADSAVTLGLWLTAPNQDMSKKANVLAGTIFHEIGHTLGLSHGGLYFDTPNSYVPTFDANCKPNYQSVMNYLFQLDLVGPNQTLAFSNQTLNPINENSAGSVTQLTDASGNPATFPTSAWYVPYTLGSPVSPATRHCDGTPLTGDSSYRVDASIAPVTPAWSSPQDLSFIGTLQSSERGFNDLTNMDLRQVGATGGQFASLATLLSFGSSVAPLNISAGGNVTLGSGGTIALGSGGNITLGSGGNVTLGSGGTIALGSGGNITLGSGGNATVPSGSVITPGGSGNITLGSGGNVTLGSGGTITLGSGGNITLGSGGNVTLGSGGNIALGSGGNITVPSSGGTYSIDGSGGVITLGSGGNITLGSGGNVTLGSGGNIALGSGGNITLGSGGNITLGSGGNITLGSGGNVVLGSGGTVTLGSGGNIAAGDAGNITLGSGGAASIGAGGTITLGSGGSVAINGGAGNITLGSGGNITLGSGGSLTLNSGGNVTLGSGGNITLGSGGVVTPFGGLPIVVAAGGNITLGSGGNIALGSGGNITLGSGGNIALGSGGNIALGSGGNIALGSGGTIVLGSGGNITLGSGGVVTLGTNGSLIQGTGSSISLGSVNNITPASGGPLAANELTYETANSVVRPPTTPTETPSAAGTSPASVRINWKAPAFGVVQTYTIYRSSNGASPLVIGSVSGVNGNPPATEFTDTNPDTVSATVVYTVTTSLVPDTAGPSRQSVPSLPAVIKNDQSIILGPLPSSVTLANPPIVTATAISGGVPTGLQVAFSATGSCVIGSQSIAGNISSAAVTLATTGSCTVTAAQSGTTAFNAANSVSGTFMVLPLNSGTKSQTITFPFLPNAQYGQSFALNATSSVPNQVISYAASGPCTTNGGITGIGVCRITASAPATSTYSAASLSQSFNIYPAVLKVIANSLTVPFGRPIPALTYGYSGFVNGDSTAVVSGAPVLSTTGTPSSNVGSYPIVVATGTLATTNYSFLYVNGALTVQAASQSALTLTTTSPLTFNQSEALSVTGGSSGGAVTYNLVSGTCTIVGARLTANSGTGACVVTATMAGNSNYNSVTSTPAAISLSPAAQAITFTTSPPASAPYNGSFTVAATSTSGGAVAFTSAGSCSNTGAIYKMTSSTGICSVIANQAGNSNYAAAAPVIRAVTATGPLLSLSTSAIDFGTLYLGSISTQKVTVTNIGTAPVTINDPILSIVKGGNSNEFLALSLCPRPLAAGKSCTVTVAFLAGPFYTPQTSTLQIMSNAPGSPQAITLNALVINPLAKLDPTSLNFGKIKHATNSSLTVTLSNPGATSLSLRGISVTGPNAAYFTQSNACGTSLPAGASCKITVKFAPPIAGTFSANLIVADNARTGTQTVVLTGAGN